MRPWLEQLVAAGCLRIANGQLKSSKQTTQNGNFVLYNVVHWWWMYNTNYIKLHVRIFQIHANTNI